jgi:hypothetical protein
MDTCQLSIGCDMKPLKGKTTSFWNEGKINKFVFFFLKKKSRDTHVVKIPSSLTVKPNEMLEFKILKTLEDTLQIFKLW